ncbi:MAG: ribonuclease P protein component [bacterium]|nr:ribonuclease P protein component [bacterium]
MLPKANRIPSFEIRTVMRSGRRVSDRDIELVYTSNHIGTARFAFIVSTRVDKRATRRNRVKRLMREAVHRALPHMQGNVDAVFIARSKYNVRDESGIAQRIETLLSRVHIV